MSLATLTSKIIGSMPARRGNVYETTIRKRRADGTVREAHATSTRVELAVRALDDRLGAITVHTEPQV